MKLFNFENSSVLINENFKLLIDELVFKLTLIILYSLNNKYKIKHARGNKQTL